MLKSPKQSRLKAVALAAALACSSLAANAAGLGRITVLSALGQPLKAELEVTANRDELNSLTAKLAPADAFRVAGIEYSPVLTSLYFSREVKERNGRRFIEIRSDRPVNEPFVDMLVELSWASGRLVREYTFLLDPPELAQKVAPVGVAVPAAAAPATDGIRVAPVTDSQPQAKAVPEMAPVKPSRAVAKSAPATPAAGEGGKTRLIVPGDTLGKIASETRPEGVSLDQMLVALFRSNADAFDGNMNRMRAGKILNLPEPEAVKGIDATEARREVVAQSSDFNAYRRKLADVAAKSAPSGESGRVSTGKIAPKVEDKAVPPAAAQDKLKVSPTEVAPSVKADPKKPDSGAQISGRLSALEEDLVARERALREANSRIVQLEKNLGDLKKLAELKSEGGAALQKQAEAAKAPAAPTPPAPAPAKPAEPVVVAKAPPAAEPVAKAPEGDAKPVPAAPAAEAPKPPAPPKKKVAPPPEPEPEPDFIAENGPLVFGGAGLLALLLGYLGFSAARRKKKAAAEPEPHSKADLSTDSVFSESAPESINVTAAAPSEFSISEAAPEAPAEPVDPLVEAGTYLAFGRDAQAEEILLEALKTEPTRHAIHVKLLEIYSARRSTLQFNTLAKELRDQTGGQGPDWERVLAMGLALDPGNSIYKAAPGSVDPDATAVFAAPPPLSDAVVVEPVAEAAAAQGEEVASLDFDLDLGAPSAEPAAPAQAAPAAESVSLDFDLDLGEPAASAGETAPAAASDGVAALDIDFDLDTSAAPPAAAVEEPVTADEVPDLPVPASDADAGGAIALDIDFGAEEPAPAASPVAAPVVEATREPHSGNIIDFDLALPAVGAEAAGSAPAEAAPAPAADTVAALDFDFDLGEATPAAPASNAMEAPPVLDLSSISLDLDAPQPAGVPAAEIEVPALSLETAPVSEPQPQAAAASAVADNPEAATKLELALAYEEMGDRDGARELLEEVVKEGSPAQQEVAQAKLAALG